MEQTSTNLTGSLGCLRTWFSSWRKNCGCQAVAMIPDYHHKCSWWSKTKIPLGAWWWLWPSTQKCRNSLQHIWFKARSLASMPAICDLHFTFPHSCIERENVFLSYPCRILKPSLSYPSHSCFQGWRSSSQFTLRTEAFLIQPSRCPPPKFFQFYCILSDTKTSSNSICEQITDLHTGTIMFYFVGFYLILLNNY